MMRRLLLVAGLLFGAGAQAAGAPFLWQVQTPKTKHYLMGSVHLLPENAYPLPPALDAAYKGADTLVFESDIAALSDPKTQLQMLAEAKSDAGLKAQAGDELYARVRAYAEKNGLPPELCDNFKAWFCALTLELTSFQASDYRPDLGIDQHYYALGSSAQKTILWLEEPAAHLKLFTAMPDNVAAQLLAAALDEHGSGGISPDELLKAWQGNDVAALDALVTQFKTEQPLLYDRLLAARNRAWLPRLQKLLAGDHAQLVIVGAAHLVGSDGLVALLKAQGYAVTPVALPAPPLTTPATPEGAPPANAAPAPVATPAAPVAPAPATHAAPVAAPKPR